MQSTEFLPTRNKSNRLSKFVATAALIFAVEGAGMQPASADEPAPGTTRPAGFHECAISEIGSLGSYPASLHTINGEGVHGYKNVWWCLNDQPNPTTTEQITSTIPSTETQLTTTVLVTTTEKPTTVDTTPVTQPASKAVTTVPATAVPTTELSSTSASAEASTTASEPSSSATTKHPSTSARVVTSSAEATGSLDSNTNTSYTEPTPSTEPTPTENESNLFATEAGQATDDVEQASSNHKRNAILVALGLVSVPAVGIARVPVVAWYRRRTEDQTS